VLVLLAKIVGRATSALPHNLGGRGGPPCPHEEMDMVWLNYQVENLPAHLHAFLPDKFVAVLRYGPTSTRLRRFEHQTKW